MRARLHSPASERNREPIAAVLRRVLPESGLVLEVGSGSGQHAAYFGAELPGIVWQPSDAGTDNHPSIAAWAEHEGATNVRPAIQLDATTDPWPDIDPCAVFSANVIHISPWEVCLGLLRGAGQRLAPGGALILYGPYRIAGQHTSPGNAEFDSSLKQRNPAWGIRDLERVVDAATDCNLSLEERVAMPANNQTLIFRR